MSGVLLLLASTSQQGKKNIFKKESSKKEILNKRVRVPLYEYREVRPEDIKMATRLRGGGQEQGAAVQVIEQ